MDRPIDLDQRRNERRDAETSAAWAQINVARDKRLAGKSPEAIVAFGWTQLVTAMGDLRQGLQQMNSPDAALAMRYTDQCLGYLTTVVAELIAPTEEK